MENNMILIMIDELGDEIELEQYSLSLDLDDDELEVWQERKRAKARERFPEAQGFYFEDRRHWNRLILQDIRDWM